MFHLVGDGGGYTGNWRNLVLLQTLSRGPHSRPPGGNMRVSLRVHTLSREKLAELVLYIELIINYCVLIFIVENKEKTFGQIGTDLVQRHVVYWNVKLHRKESHRKMWIEGNWDSRSCINHDKICQRSLWNLLRIFHWAIMELLTALYKKYRKILKNARA